MFFEIVGLNHLLVIFSYEGNFLIFYYYYKFITLKRSYILGDLENKLTNRLSILLNKKYNLSTHLTTFMIKDLTKNIE